MWHETEGPPEEQTAAVVQQADPQCAGLFASRLASRGLTASTGSSSTDDL